MTDLFGEEVMSVGGAMEVGGLRRDSWRRFDTPASLLNDALDLFSLWLFEKLCLEKLCLGFRLLLNMMVVAMRRSGLPRLGWKMQKRKKRKNFDPEAATLETKSGRKL